MRGGGWAGGFWGARSHGVFAPRRGRLTCCSSSAAGRLHLPVLALPLGDAEHPALRQPGPQGHHQTRGQQGRAAGRGRMLGPAAGTLPEPPLGAPRSPGRSCCKAWRKRSGPCSWRTSPCASSSACPRCPRGAGRCWGPPRGRGHSRAGRAGPAPGGHAAPHPKGSSWRREPQPGPASTASCGTSWWRTSSSGTGGSCWNVQDPQKGAPGAGDLPGCAALGACL